MPLHIICTNICYNHLSFIFTNNGNAHLPVMGLTFGTTVKKKDLVIKGLVNEIVSLIMCFIIGIIVCIFMTIGGTPETRNWPSSEMMSRGDPYGLAAGFFVAIPSGIASK